MTEETLDEITMEILDCQADNIWEILEEMECYCESEGVIL